MSRFFRFSWPPCAPAITEAAIPRGNEEDLPEVPENIRSLTKIHLVENMDRC